MFFKCHVIFFLDIDEYQCCNHLKQWEVFHMNHEFLWHAKAWVQLQFSDAMKKDSQKWRLFIFSTIPSHQNGWALTPCGATHGLWSFWLWGLLRNVGVIDTSVGHGLLRRFKTGFYRTVKSREKLHISTPFVTPKVIINGFPFGLLFGSMLRYSVPVTDITYTQRNNLIQINSYNPLYPGELWFWFRRKYQKTHNFELVELHFEEWPKWVHLYHWRDAIARGDAVNWWRISAGLGSVGGGDWFDSSLD